MQSRTFNPAAIIVTFNPEATALVRLVTLLAPQVGKIFIIDNTPAGFTPPEEIARHPKAKMIPLGDNLGAAAGHNRGIEKARNAGFTHVLLMDQDSVPAAGMVSVLYGYLSELEREGLRIGAVGPQLIDALDGKPRGFVTTRSGRYARIRNAGTSWVRCDYLTTSGTLIPIKVIDAVGPMEEALFIDGVDIEWGYRAASNGFACIGVFEARMRHTKGERMLSLLGFRQSLYAPIRHYYAFRNFYALARRGYISPAWKRHVLLTTPLYALMLATLAAPRLENLKMILRGVTHGVKQHSGPIN